MPIITFAPGVASSPLLIDSLIDTFIFGASITSASATLVTAQSGPVTYALSGTGFTFGSSGFTGGLVDQLVTRDAGLLQVTVSNIGLAALSIQTAALQESSGTDTAALENLLLAQNWTYNGNANADVLLATDTSADGVLLNLRGNDLFNTGGGNDNVFLGDGNDTAHGGTGNDRVNGGSGLDLLYGDAGADVLYGGIQDDRLWGNAGNDRLFGGAGRDVLFGGTGDDQMKGDAGVDRFVFQVGDNQDQILDFVLGVDRIDFAPGVVSSFQNFAGQTLVLYGPGGDSVLLSGIAFSDSALVTII